MEAPYTWHQGARCLNPRWPLTPSILIDELFSSWLVRTAHAHRCLPSTLTGIVWPGVQAWKVDLDRRHSWANMEVLSSLTGLKASSLLASTLWPIAQKLHPNGVAEQTTHLPWILPLGCRNRSHTGGLLCCPCCMTDPVPHYLLQYRLAWHTVCPRHRTLLIDRCLRCSSALQPNRLRPDSPLSMCHQCGQSLGDVSPEPIVTSALAFQSFADSASQSTALYGTASLSFSEWMSVARVMVSFLKNVTRNPTTKSQLFCQAMGVDLSQLKSSSLGLPFEYATPAERAGLLGQAWVIMQAGPERFLELAGEVELPVTMFPARGIGGSPILAQMVSVLVKHTRHTSGRPSLKQTREPLEVWRMWNRLQRRTHRNGIS